MKILAIDPGNTLSAWVIYESRYKRLVKFGKIDNQSLLRLLTNGMDFAPSRLAIETMKPRGMPTSFEEMQTQLWAGRFIQAWWDRQGGEEYATADADQIFRINVKMHITGQARAKDSNIRQSIIDRYGGKEKAIGKKKTPGPLFGVSNDCWSALAIAITFCETVLDKKSREG